MRRPDFVHGPWSKSRQSGQASTTQGNPIVSMCGVLATSCYLAIDRPAYSESRALLRCILGLCMSSTDIGACIQAVRCRHPLLSKESQGPHQISPNPSVAIANVPRQVILIINFCWANVLKRILKGLVAWPYGLSFLPQRLEI